MYKPQFGKKDFEITERERLSDGYFKLDRLGIRHRLFEGGWSNEVKRELLVRHKAAAVLLYDPERQEVVLVEQFRVGAIDSERGPWCLELVAGIADKEESLEELVMREAQEESGCSVEALVPVHNYMASPGGSSESLSIFCGKTDSSRAGGVHGLDDENEDIKVHVIPVAELPSLLEKGALNNAAALIAVQWLLLNKENIQFS